MQARTQEEQQPASIVPGEGWSLQRPSDPDYYVSAVICHRIRDGGENVKLFQVSVKPEVAKRRLSELQRKAKKLKRLAKRQADEAEAKLAKTRVRALLASLGKH